MHRAESILDALTAQLTGLATTGAAVYRGFAHIDAVPAITIRMGDDDLVGEQSSAVVDRALSVVVESAVTASETTDTTLNQIRGEVYAAVVANPTLGLGYVVNSYFEIDDAPEQKDNTKPIVKQQLRYVIRYRHSYASAEA